MSKHFRAVTQLKIKEKSEEWDKSMKFMKDSKLGKNQIVFANVLENNDVTQVQFHIFDERLIYFNVTYCYSSESGKPESQ